MNLDRTSSWLASQSFPGDNDKADSPDLPQPFTLGPETYNEAPVEPEGPPVPPKSPGDQDQTFLRGFEHLRQNQQLSDTFVHRKTRTEKLRLDRKCLFSSHVSPLE